MNLNESLYLKGLQCHKHLWLQCNKPEILKLENPDEEFGRVSAKDACRLARDLFPTAVEISSSDPDERIRMTADKIAAGPVTLFDAAFQYGRFQSVIDVFEKKESGAVSIHRIKGVTRVRKPHISELSYQYYLLSALGFKIEEADIISLNKAYIREGDLDLKALFQFNDLKKEVLGMQKELPQMLESMQSMLEGSLPDRAIGPHCSTPAVCEARNLCWKSIPSPSVFDISTLSPELKMKFYNRGIVEFHQINDFSDLTAHQKMQVECELSGQSRMDEDELKRFLSSLSYPLSHLDFEAFQQAVPLWDGIRPYAHIPFQYSLHIEEKDGSLEHREHLAVPGQDPRRLLAERLIKDLPAEGTVLVYNQAFEKGILKSLAKQFPDLSESLTAVSERISDLMVPFRNKKLYSPLMEGKYSIKSVLPALVPEMEDAYGKLDLVHNGLEAMKAYSEMENTDRKKREALLKYCELDTLAMVKILGAIRSIIEK